MNIRVISRVTKKVKTLLRKLGNFKKSLKSLELMASLQPVTQKPNFAIVLENCNKSAAKESREAQYFVHDTLKKQFFFSNLVQTL